MLKRADYLTRQAHSWAWELRDDMVWYAQILKSHPTLFTPNQIRTFRTLFTLLTNATNRLDEIKNDIKELSTDVSNLLAPFNEDFKYIQNDYQDTLQKLHYINDKLNPLRQIADNIDNVSIVDLLSDFEIDSNILGLTDTFQDVAGRKLSDDD